MFRVSNPQMWRQCPSPDSCHFLLGMCKWRRKRLKRLNTSLKSGTPVPPGNMSP